MRSVPRPTLKGDKDIPIQNNRECFLKAIVRLSGRLCRFDEGHLCRQFLVQMYLPAFDALIILSASIFVSVLSSALPPSTSALSELFHMINNTDSIPISPLNNDGIKCFDTDDPQIDPLDPDVYEIPFEMLARDPDAMNPSVIWHEGTPRPFTRPVPEHWGMTGCYVILACGISLQFASLSVENFDSRAGFGCGTYR